MGDMTNPTFDIGDNKGGMVAPTFSSSAPPANNNNASSTTDILVALQDGVTALNRLTVILGGIFPATGNSGSATDAEYEIVTSYGATGNGTTLDTAAFVSCINAAVSKGKKVLIPQGRYRVGALDLTAATLSVAAGTTPNGVIPLIIEGLGEKSVLLPDATGVWIDLTGSQYVQFLNFKVEQYSTVQPDFLFVWMAAVFALGFGANVPVVQMSFQFVDISAATTKAHFYAFGGLGLYINGCHWTQTYGGAATADPSLRTTVIYLSSENTLAVASPFVATGAAAMGRVVLSESTFMEFSNPPTYTSNAAAAIFFNVEISTIISCGFFSGGETNMVLWHFCEGLTFIECEWRSSSGAGLVNFYSVIIGGHICSTLTFIAPFLSDLKAGGAYFAIGPRVGVQPYLDGGVAQLTLLTPDVGANTFNNPLVGLTKNYVAGDELSPWLIDSQIHAQNNANNIVTSGSIDNTTVIQNPGTVTTFGGTQSQGNVKSLQTIRKVGTQTVTNSTTLVDDDTFSFPITLNELLAIEMNLFVFGPAGGDISFGFTLPAGCTMNAGYLGPTATSTNALNTAVTLQSVAAGSIVTVGCDGTNQQLVKIVADVVNGASAGAVNLQWTQTAPSTTGTQIRAGSRAMVMRT